MKKCQRFVYIFYILCNKAVIIFSIDLILKKIKIINYKKFRKCEICKK